MKMLFIGCIRTVLIPLAVTVPPIPSIAIVETIGLFDCSAEGMAFFGLNDCAPVGSVT